MDSKKSNSANLEDKRLTGFLLGLIFALAVVFAALQYNAVPSSQSDGDADADDFFEELDMPLVEDRSDMFSAAPAPAAASQSVTENVKLVDHPLPTRVDKISPNATKLLIGDGEAVAKAAKVTAAVPPVPTAEVVEKPLDFRIVEQLPEFPGGMASLTQWLTNNLHYPPVAQRRNIQGKVVVSFVINKDGSISDRKIEHGVHPLLDNEAMRVVRLMPRWKPGVQNDKPCRTLFAIPIVFAL